MEACQRILVFRPDEGAGEIFVVEADEYDTAFFDKRSKFIHYHADVFGINNLEFDHADIFTILPTLKHSFIAIRRAALWFYHQ